jgi:DNA polymerase IV
VTSRPAARTIVHIDMDAFFVACEVRRRPELAGLPVIVGGTGPRGVVAAASYEARRFGVHSAMPSVRAQRLCPQAIVLQGDHSLYEEVSREVQAIFARYTPMIEPISLDEAFLDVTGARRLFGSGEKIGHAIRQAVFDELSLTCSVGVAPSKMVAKMASEAAKPKASPQGTRPGRGVVVVSADNVLRFLHAHPVQALWGVGPKTLERLERLGVVTIGDLAASPLQGLVAALGTSHGHHLHELANGRDERPVEPDRQVKSIGHEQTFREDLHDRASIALEVLRMADAVAARAREAGVAGRTVQLKVRFGDFSTITRAKSVPEPLSSGPEITAVGRALLEEIDTSLGVRLLGVSLSGLGEEAPKQLSLDDAESPNWDDASKTIDDIRSRFGRRAIGPASLVEVEGLRLKERGGQQWGPNQ